MFKINKNLVALALLTGISNTALANTGEQSTTVAGNSRVIIPIALDGGDYVDFGKIVASADDDVCTMDKTGSISGPGCVVNNVDSHSPQIGTFTLQSENGLPVQISLATYTDSYIEFTPKTHLPGDSNTERVGSFAYTPGDSSEQTWNVYGALKILNKNARVNAFNVAVTVAYN